MQDWLKNFIIEKVFVTLFLWTMVAIVYMLAPLLPQLLGYDVRFTKAISISKFYEAGLLAAIPIASLLLISLFQISDRLLVPIRERRAKRLQGKQTKEFMSDEEVRKKFHSEAVSQICGIASVLSVSSGLYAFDSFMGQRVMQNPPASIFPGLCTAAFLYIVGLFWYWLIFRNSSK